MNLKTYIAIFFAIVFFGKFLVIDSKILVSILDADEIAYVNPFCKKQNAKIQGSAHESFSEDSNRLIITLDSFCNAPFKFKVFNWEYRVMPEESQPYVYHTPIIPEPFQDRYYPPPKV